jgi:lysozyme
MVTSQVGIDLIKRFEGLRLTAYLDAVGIPTIGYGHTHATQLGQRISQEEAETLLRGDIASFERVVSETVTYRLNQSQFDALVSFAYNTGADAFRKSSLVKLLNEGKLYEAVAQFARWDHAGGHILSGLTARRAAEREIFLSKISNTDEKAEAKAQDPDQITIDLPTLREPFTWTAATRILCDLLDVSVLEELPDAVRNAQRTHELTQDGIVGPVTWAAILGN